MFALRRLVVLVVFVALIASVATSSAARSGAICADFPNQAAAQRAADTEDPDHDGVYCESLPCPCLKPEGGGHASCASPKRVQVVSFSATEYPHIRRHFRDAVRAGWPSLLVVNRRGADARRERLLASVPTMDGFDRDEYPPAVGRGKGTGLQRGRHPRGWKADVRLVPSGENRSHGTSLGDQLRPFCNGVRFKYVFL